MVIRSKKANYLKFIRHFCFRDTGQNNERSLTFVQGQNFQLVQIQRKWAQINQIVIYVKKMYSFIYLSCTDVGQISTATNRTS